MEENIDLEELAMATAPLACPHCHSERVRPLTLRQVANYLLHQGRAEEHIAPVNLEVWECLDCETAWEPNGA